MVGWGLRFVIEEIIVGSMTQKRKTPTIRPKTSESYVESIFAGDMHSKRVATMMMIAVIAMALLTMLGEAGERSGLDRLLKTSTRKRRQLSLFRQGLRWYDLMPMLRDDRLLLLMETFVAVMAEHRLCRDIYGAEVI